MANLTVQTISIAGVDRTAGFVAAAAGGDDFPNAPDERTFFDVINAGGSACVVTVVAIITSVKVSGHGDLTVPNIVVSVPSGGGQRSIGPFSQAYIDSAGKINVTYDQVVTVTVKPVKVPRLA